MGAWKRGRMKVIFTLWKLERKTVHFRSQFRFQIQSTPERAKMYHETLQMRSEVEKKSQNGSLLAWKKRVNGVDKRLKE